MERDGLIVLPPRRSTRVLRPSRDRTAAGPRPSGSSAAYPSTKEGKLWNAGHYLGFTPMSGAQHFVRSAEGEPLAMLGFGAAEDRTASSWERRQPAFRRQQREVTALGQNQTYPMSSHRRCLLDDRRYALRPALLETFCESLAGTCCRAANPGRQNTGPRQARREKRICAAGQGCKASSTGRRFSIADHHPGSERLPSELLTCCLIIYCFCLLFSQSPLDIESCLVERVSGRHVR